MLMFLASMLIGFVVAVALMGLGACLEARYGWLRDDFTDGR